LIFLPKLLQNHDFLEIKPGCLRKPSWENWAKMASGATRCSTNTMFNPHTMVFNQAPNQSTHDGVQPQIQMNIYMTKLIRLLIWTLENIAQLFVLLQVACWACAALRSNLHCDKKIRMATHRNNNCTTCLCFSMLFLLGDVSSISSDPSVDRRAGGFLAIYGRHDATIWISGGGYNKK
jgi:hypothetical protein